MTLDVLPFKNCNHVNNLVNEKMKLKFNFQGLTILNILDNLSHSF